jgi:hypothetical protein
VVVFGYRTKKSLKFSLSETLAHHPTTYGTQEPPTEGTQLAIQWGV